MNILDMWGKKNPKEVFTQSITPDIELDHDQAHMTILPNSSPIQTNLANHQQVPSFEGDNTAFNMPDERLNSAQIVSQRLGNIIRSDSGGANLARRTYQVDFHEQLSAFLNNLEIQYYLNVAKKYDPKQLENSNRPPEFAFTHRLLPSDSDVHTLRNLVSKTLINRPELVKIVYSKEWSNCYTIDVRGKMVLNLQDLRASLPQYIDTETKDWNYSSGPDFVIDGRSTKVKTILTLLKTHITEKLHELKQEGLPCSITELLGKKMIDFVIPNFSYDNNVGMGQICTLRELLLIESYAPIPGSCRLSVLEVKPVEDGQRITFVILRRKTT